MDVVNPWKAGRMQTCKRQAPEYKSSRRSNGADTKRKRTNAQRRRRGA
jgi:hypothetical protein